MSCSSTIARADLEARTGLDEAFIAGYEWALWDYDDANGLRPSVVSRRRVAG